MEELLNTLRAWQYKILVFAQHFGKRTDNAINTLTVLVSVLGLLDVVWQIGFDAEPEVLDWIIRINGWFIVVIGLAQVYRVIWSAVVNHKFSLWSLVYMLTVWCFIILRGKEGIWQPWINHPYIVDGVFVVVAVYEISSLSISFLARKSSPTMLFAGSFLVFIAVGTGLLLMPNCHKYDMTFLDALFTSTSCVCVTGMSVFDLPLPEVFNHEGMIVILVLIQVGGLGVMTFTCFFALSLGSGSSLQNRMVIKDLISADNMLDIFETLKHIMYVTFIIEGFAAWILFLHIRDKMPDEPFNSVLFHAVFHAVSGFCNAGISSYPHGLEDPILDNSHRIRLTMALTIIFGGMGFPLQSAVINWFKTRVHWLTQRIIGRGKPKEWLRLRQISAANRMIFYSNVILLTFGTVFFFISEYNVTQAGDTFLDRFTESFFLSATSRTAGFLYHGVADYSAPTLMVLSILMWIGCAPLSTGGGIKVTTFSVGVLNLYNTLRGKDYIEIFGRRVSGYSVRRAFAVMMVSVIAIFVSTIALKVAMPAIDTTSLLFESCAALSTAGMSMDLTPQLSTVGRIIIMVDMFIGRIGVMAFLLIFITPGASQRYKYPSENIMT